MIFCAVCWFYYILPVCITNDIFFSVKVLFTFDSKFYKEFHGKDGKSAEEHMEEIIRIVKLAYKDKTMKTQIGTHVNIIGYKRMYEGSTPL